MVELLPKKSLLKDTNKKKRLAWAKKHEQWTLEQWKSVIGSGVQIGDLWLQPPCFCEVRCRGTDDFPTVKYGRGGVTVWGCFAGESVCDLFRI